MCMRRSIWVSEVRIEAGSLIIYSQILKILIFDILIMKKLVLVELPRLQSTVTNFFRVPWTFLLYPPFSATTRHSSHDNRFSFVSERLEFNVFSFSLIWQIVTWQAKALCFTSSVIEIEIFLWICWGHCGVRSQVIAEIIFCFKKLIVPRKFFKKKTIWQQTSLPKWPHFLLKLFNLYYPN